MDSGKIYDFELLRAERRALSMALDLGIQLDPRIHPLDFVISLYNEAKNLRESGKISQNLLEIEAKIEKEYPDIFSSLKSRHLID